MNETPAFIPPPYPYDRLDELKALGERHPGGLVDCSIGTPIDPPPASVVAALSTSEAERSYPPSIGTEAFREQVAAWSHTRFGVRIDPGSEVAAAVGTKEFVAGLPHWMKLRNPSRDTVLYPAVSYPSYEMGATLAGCRAVAVPVNEDWSIQLESISEEDAKRALLMWVNTPGNPAGGLDNLE
ncbi:MAG TPA: succinyldiaminopimelate transaminase, partial [Acidimicrobiaceae bacterium]|nr:succinyldiaminopimelate transaminase [Acidimicrobiaceae bacterium]